MSVCRKDRNTFGLARATPEEEDEASTAVLSSPLVNSDYLSRKLDSYVV